MKHRKRDSGTCSEPLIGSSPEHQKPQNAGSEPVTRRISRNNFRGEVVVPTRYRD